MTKPREFWIIPPRDGFEGEVVIKKEEFSKDFWPQAIHVREIVPIDWDKVWDRYTDKEFQTELIDEYDARLIQSLVEKQLKGEE